MQARFVYALPFHLKHNAGGADVAASFFCDGVTKRVPGEPSDLRRSGSRARCNATRATDCTGVSIVACRIEFYPEKAQSLAPIPPATKTSLRFFNGTVRFPTAQVRSDAYPS